MGAVRKLATVVIIGLVALSTLLVVYLAAEPARRDDETSEQNAVSIERGTSLYITYCLQCHGPAGLGAAGARFGEEPARTGAVLNQEAVYTEEDYESARAIFQSDDPVQQGIAEDWIRYRIMYGAPPEQMTQGFDGPIAMPAFRNDLNVEEINNLVYLIMYGDWDYVYNTAVHETGVAVAEAVCLENPDGEHCDDTSHAPPVYPTPPAPVGASAPPEATGAEASPEAQPEEGAEAAEPASDGGGDAIELEAQDVAFSQTEFTARPGDTVTLTNTGFLQHDFAVDEWGGAMTPLLNNGETAEFTIPEDAAPGEYEFYCSVPGHREQGMEGTLIIEAP